MPKSPETTYRKPNQIRRLPLGKLMLTASLLGGGVIGAGMYFSTQSKAPEAQAQAFKDQGQIQTNKDQLITDTAKQQALLGSVSPDCAAIVRKFLGTSEFALSYSTIDAQTLVTETRACPLTDINLVYDARNNDSAIQGDNSLISGEESDMALQLSIMSNPYSDRRGNTEYGIFVGVVSGMVAAMGSDAIFRRRQTERALSGQA